MMGSIDEITISLTKVRRLAAGVIAGDGRLFQWPLRGLQFDDRLEENDQHRGTVAFQSS